MKWVALSAGKTGASGNEAIGKWAKKNPRVPKEEARAVLHIGDYNKQLMSIHKKAPVPPARKAVETASTEADNTVNMDRSVHAP